MPTVTLHKLILMGCVIGLGALAASLVEADTLDARNQPLYRVLTPGNAISAYPVGRVHSPSGRCASRHILQTPMRCASVEPAYRRYLRNESGRSLDARSWTVRPGRAPEGLTRRVPGTALQAL